MTFAKLFAKVDRSIDIADSRFIWAAGHLQKATWLLQKSIAIIVAYQQLALLLLQKKNPSQIDSCVAMKHTSFKGNLIAGASRATPTPHQNTTSVIKGRLPSAFLSFANNSKQMMDTRSSQPFCNKSSKPSVLDFVIVLLFIECRMFCH